MTTPGAEIARALADLGLTDPAIVRALRNQLGLTSEEAQDAVRAAAARAREVLESTP